MLYERVQTQCAVSCSPNRNQEGQPYRSHGNSADDVPGQAFPENAVHCGAEQRQNRYEPEQIHCHHFSRLLRSTLSDSRLRNIAMTKPRPTAASAAATTKTKKTKI